MNQRIRVVALIKNENGVLILKRRHGRSDAPVFWELPTGKINFGEQPEEAMERALEENVGVQPTSIKLRDVITFLALEGSSQLNNLYIIYEVTIDRDDKIEPYDRYSAYKFLRPNTGGDTRLNEASLAVLEIENEKPATAPSENMSYRGAASGATVYTDGASRGNPGPSGIGYYIVDENNQLIERGGEFIGFATSRVAEYCALRKGIDRAIELGLKSVRFVNDNLMMINQMNGIYQIKNKDIAPIYDDIKEKIQAFDSCAFVHVKRSMNSAADKEASLAIERILNRR